MRCEDLYREVSEHVFGQALNGIWAYFQVKDSVPGVNGIAIEVFGFEKCKEAFFIIVERLMREGRLKLAKEGRLWTGNVESQIRCFQTAFPKSNEEVDLGGAGVWFFTDACPAGAVWIDQNGEEVWT